MHLLLVPSTAVQYDEEKERKIQFEAKQKRLQKAEEARQLELHSENDKGQEEASEGWIQRLLANIIKNLEVTITRVHIRFEDQQKNSNGYPYATGVTLDKVQMKTINLNANSSENMSKFFVKQVLLESFAIYWKPKANLHSEDKNINEDTIDLMFDANIGTREKPSTKLKYLLGPISSEASLKWCPSPERFDYDKPIVDLSIKMNELGTNLKIISSFEFPPFFRPNILQTFFRIFFFMIFGISPNLLLFFDQIFEIFFSELCFKIFRFSLIFFLLCLTNFFAIFFQDFCK